MVDLRPKVCNLCGGKVRYISNAKIYGRKYGSGYCYWCSSCGAYVGTHCPWPKKAMGILADAEMRQWKKKCHDLFDPFWNSAEQSRHKVRMELYHKLAVEMGIPDDMCHFGYFQLDELKCAYEIMENRVE